MSLQNAQDSFLGRQANAIPPPYSTGFIVAVAEFMRLGLHQIVARAAGA